MHGFVASLHEAKRLGRALRSKTGKRPLQRVAQKLPRRPWGETNHASRLWAASTCHACASNPPPELEDGSDLHGFLGNLHEHGRLGQGLRRLDPISNGRVALSN